MKFQSKYICQQCGYTSGGWLGKCPQCDSWNSLVEEVVETGVTKGTGESRLRQGYGGQAREIKPLRLSEIKTAGTQRLKTGVEEFDRVLGGGLVPGTIILVAGEPGVGKSTLLSSVFKKAQVLYVSGEESAQQIKLRMERLKAGNNFLIVTETNVEAVIELLRGLSPSPGLRRAGKFTKTNKTDVPNVVVIDSIQTMWTTELNSTIGSVGQVRECANKLLNLGKAEDLPVFLIGHVTKEGVIAGPKILEHMVDTVLYLEGERFQSLRLLRATKNRFGPTDEVGVFKMESGGLVPVENPSEVFLSTEGDKGVKGDKVGSVVTCTMEGTRPILAEIQALVVSTQIPVPRRVVSGLDYNRTQLIIAILQKYLHLPLYSSDIYVSVSGGLKILEPAADLAIALSIWSSFKNKALSGRLAAFGEISLLGEIRSVGNSERRKKEAKRLGFEPILVGNNLIEIINQLH